MTIDVKALLLGAPKPQEIAAVIRQEFGCDVEVRDSSVEDFFHVLFPDPEGRRPGDAKRRMLSVLLNPSDSRNVCTSPHTWCSLGSSGGANRVIGALASWFGGFVMDEAKKEEEWEFVGEGEPREPGEPSPLSPEDLLRIELEERVGPSKAMTIAALVDDPEALEAVMEAYATFKARKAEVEADCSALGMSR